MKQKNYSEMTDEELLIEKKSSKNRRFFMRFLLVSWPVY